MKLSKLIKRVAAATFLVASVVLSGNPAPAFADAGRIVTIGADLTQSQRSQVLDFFGLTDADLENMQVITVNNQDERRYLEGTLSDAVIGTQTISCSYIEPTTSGGINVETANLTYVTKNTLYNALQTAGVENANLVVTAPYKVSGTGALTGVFMAYEADGKKLDDAKKEAATQEMVDTANLESKYGTGAAEVVGDVKNQVVSSDTNPSDDQIREMIKSAAQEKGISLSDQDIDTILGIVNKVKDLGYDKDAFANTLDQINSKLDELSQKSDGILGAIQGFFKQVGEWFSNLFAVITGGSTDNAGDGSGATDGDTAHSDAGILGGLNTDIFKLDSGKSGDAGDGTASDSGSGVASEGEGGVASGASSASVSGDQSTDGATDGAGQFTDTGDSGASDNGAGADAQSVVTGSEPAAAQ